MYSKKILDVMPSVLIQIIGLMVAILTRNTGNFLIFLGILFVTISHALSGKLTKASMFLGRLIYIIGIIWSVFQPAAMALGWGTVFLTLFIGTIDFSKN